jgi:hypothetical protein
MYNDLPDATADALFRELTPHSAGAFNPWEKPLPWVAGDITGIPKIFVVHARDAVIDPEKQRTMAKAVGARVIEIDAGHSAWASRMGEMVDLLVGVAGEVV